MLSLLTPEKLCIYLLLFILIGFIMYAIQAIIHRWIRSYRYSKIERENREREYLTKKDIHYMCLYFELRNQFPTEPPDAIIKRIKDNEYLPIENIYEIERWIDISNYIKEK